LVGGTPAGTATALAFYSIGEALDLALLDARVTALVTAIGAAV
jgi:2-polyprenyl-6-methoxyphenol hydroxylase-like FAD-dependent oxidoreductase